MIFDGEILPLTLYAITKTTTKEGKWVYKPYSTIHHIRHSCFLVASLHNLLEVYGYRKGEYTPHSDVIERGISKYLVHNPYHDYYEASKAGQLIIVKLQTEIKNVLREEELNRMKGVREKTENYTTKELNLILYSSESKYIERFPEYEHHKIIGAICKRMLRDQYRETITEDATAKLFKYFGMDLDEYLCDSISWKWSNEFKEQMVVNP
ncbi:MAG: hypothetical protein R2685_10595 [Candidatus Nitrosocosmicus sp.]|nr:hypothetical protein [Candidatus Nitrosocosmicus sp.]